MEQLRDELMREESSQLFVSAIAQAIQFTWLAITREVSMPRVPVARLAFLR